MGALAAEIYAERAEAADKVQGVVLLSPVPPTGTARSAFFISLFNPTFIAAVTRTMKGDPTPDDVETLTNIYFAPGTNPLYAMQYMSRMQPESQRAVMEMAMLPFRVSLGLRPFVPAMVMGGQQDRVFPFWTLPWTSMLWGEMPVVVQGAGHMLMLDPAWEDGAMKILSWIKDL
jgi:pimeloyl-ACP methyl ester carboxylesterase